MAARQRREQAPGIRHVVPHEMARAAPRFFLSQKVAITKNKTTMTKKARIPKASSVLAMAACPRRKVCSRRPTLSSTTASIDENEALPFAPERPEALPCTAWMKSLRIRGPMPLDAQRDTMELLVGLSAVADGLNCGLGVVLSESKLTHNTLQHLRATPAPACCQICLRDLTAVSEVTSERKMHRNLS